MGKGLRNMHPAQETLTGHVGLEKLMQTSLLGIAQKAKQFLVLSDFWSEYS